jgi:hypothetical protein
VIVKMKMILIIHVSQKSGKSLVVVRFCKPHGKHGFCNMNDLHKVFRKFNELVGNDFLTCLNDPPEADHIFRSAGKSKAKLTSKRAIINNRALMKLGSHFGPILSK